ncbi:ectonucleoside triphosphate diphosphohydrolase 5-like [Saccostrea cucullata]|uniref:ectonucleoside triphosphate diphosphohydrolase 5-like n=1 Tax=Saccostrea cuccullata TaxID=36930 RepID=UPI002ECFD0D5
MPPGGSTGLSLYLKEMTIYVIISMGILFLMDSACAMTTQYSVMLDAGSSSTKLRVYSWPERTSTSSKFYITEKYYKKVKPSLSSFQDNLDSLPEYIKNLISIAESQVPSHRHNRSNIYLFATAGLRFVEEEKAMNLMNSVRHVLSDKRNHKFIYSERSVRILSGEEEGVFAWITANYHNGFLSSNQSQSKAVGVLEMGGGSTQITFLPDGPLLAHMFPVRISGRIFNLYSHSYLNFGTNYMEKRIKEHLIEQNPHSMDILNPCALIKTAYLYCSETIDYAVSFYKVRAEFASSTCMMGLYITELLTFAYGFPVNTDRIYSAQKINGKSLDWPFGATLYEAELMARDYPCPPISSMISAGNNLQGYRLTLLEFFLFFCIVFPLGYLII